MQLRTFVTAALAAAPVAVSAAGQLGFAVGNTNPDGSDDESKDKAADTKDESKDDAKDDSKDQSADASGTRGKPTNAKDNVPTDVKPKNPEAAKNPKKNEVTKHIAPVKSQGI